MNKAPILTNEQSAEWYVKNQKSTSHRYSALEREAQRDADQKIIDRLQEESEARRELLMRMTAKCEELQKKLDTSHRLPEDKVREIVQSLMNDTLLPQCLNCEKAKSERCTDYEMENCYVKDICDLVNDSNPMNPNREIICEGCGKFESECECER